MNQQSMERRKAVARLLLHRGDLLVVTGLGSASYDVMAAGDHDQNYYLWAAMGSAALVRIRQINAVFQCDGQYRSPASAGVYPGPEVPVRCRRGDCNMIASLQH